MKNKEVEIIHCGVRFLLKTTSVVAILYQGKPLKMKSGKCGWPSVAAAKNALRNEFYQEIKDWEFFYELFEFKEIKC